MNAPLSRPPAPDSIPDRRFQVDPIYSGGLNPNVSNEAASAAEDDLLVSWSLLHTYGRQIVQKNQSEHALALPTLPERLAHLLIERSSADNRGYILGVSYQTIAEELETYRETVVAILRAFIRRGFVQIDSRCIRVLDVDALLELSESMS